MIRINLLPREAGKKAATAAPGATRQRGNPFPLFVLILLVLYALGGAAFYWAFSQDARSWETLQEVAKRKERVQKTLDQRKQELISKTAELEDIERRYEVARALSPENRVYWSEKLNMLALARRDLAVYLTKLALTESVEEVETPESQRKREEHKAKKLPGPEPAPIKRPIINQTLNIEGVAYGRDGQERLNNVLAFQRTLKELRWRRENGAVVRFLDGMNPEFVQLPQKIDSLGGIEVMRFGFAVKAEPQTDRPAGELPQASSGASR